MSALQFDRSSWVKWYATEHLKTDPGVVSVYFFPGNANDREIRLVEVNKLMGERTDESLEPIDFGIKSGTDQAHRLIILDVTPEQWQRIAKRELPLPKDWSLDGAVQVSEAE